MDTQLTQTRRTLSAFDAACMIVGIIIGAGIYKTTPLVAAASTSSVWVMTVWVLGGVLALVGALCYAELAMTVTDAGGEYAYLCKAYGNGTGSFFAWIEFWIIRPGSTGPMAMLFGEYAQILAPLSKDPETGMLIYAVILTLVLLGLNLGGLRTGKITQNALTTFKVLALLALVAGSLAVFWFSPEAMAPVVTGSAEALSGRDLSMDGFLLAMVLVMFTYGGWNDLSYVAAEIKEPAKNIPRALLLGVLTVTVIYVLVNLAMLLALGQDGVAGSDTPATDLLKKTMGSSAEKMMALLICITAMGAVNGMMFTSARIYHALGQQVRAFQWLGHWNERFNVPARSLGLQTMVILAMVIGFGTRPDGFELMVLFVAPFMWTFLVMIGSTLFVFRKKNMVNTSTYKTPLFPLLPILFVLSSGFMAYRSADYFRFQAEQQNLLENPFFVGLVVATSLIVGSGCVVARFSRSLR
ncbi:MAG: amino acid permease [Planctomycetota bacterium]|nr:amino acid permease [Planctomycetota bacterium]